MLNFSSVAKVCLTDANTVELLINEFFSQLVQACRDSYSLKINFRKGGDYLSWMIPVSFCSNIAVLKADLTASASDDLTIRES